jgi:hypothetical protein
MRRLRRAQIFAIASGVYGSLFALTVIGAADPRVCIWVLPMAQHL